MVVCVKFEFGIVSEHFRYYRSAAEKVAVAGSLSLSLSLELTSII